MGTRARWIMIWVGVLVALGSVALYLSNTNLTMSASSLERGRKTWIVPPGETLRVSAHEVLIDDRFQCVGPSDPADTSSLKHGIGSFGGSTMVFDVEGNVTVHCTSFPAGND